MIELLPSQLQAGTDAMKFQQLMNNIRFFLTFCFLSLFFILISFAACKKPPDSSFTTALDRSWEFKQVDSLQWRDAVVPGNIHSDLLRRGLLPDPYYADNENQVQWVADTGWEYRCRFELPHRYLTQDRIELIFHGLDTYATVYLNERLLFRADNMFRTWIKDIKAFIRSGEKVLLIRFDPVSPIEQRKQAALGYELAGGSRVFTRKAGFHYGWDWGPRLVTCGIWRPVELRAWRTAKIQNLHIVQKELHDDVALLSANFEIESLKPKQAASLRIQDAQKEVLLETGAHTYNLNFKIPEPKRWWPNGWGRQHLYRLRGDLIIGRDTIDTVYERIGLRTIELVQEPDSLGSSFYFKVNGFPLFIKGANYVPQDNLQNRVDRAQYDALIQTAADANMNMLRVWGGGIYEEDIFYDLCDEYGLLVWQDFMFACAMYPGDDAFIGNVKKEAIDNIKRLRNHPSIALWCGNNENSEGWHRWGWQDALTIEQKDAVWSAYRELFQSILPAIIDSLLTDGIYWETSPKYGRGDPRHQFEGDAHYWGVWHDAEPFEVLKEKVPRFMSEFGFQSLPDLRTLEQFTSRDDRRIDSPAMQNHQKHSRGYLLINEYMERDYRPPIDFESYVYLSQVMQADGITKGIEAHRRSRPYCMGTLYWQLNDCWPAVSWSSIDYYGRRKALHYAVKKAYRDIIISIVDAENAVDIIAVSDKLTDTKADIIITRMDFQGNEHQSWHMRHIISANSSGPVMSIHKNNIATGDLKNSLLYVRAEKNGQLLDDAVFLFDKPKNLELPHPNVSYDLERLQDGCKITLQTDAFAKNIYLYSDVDGVFTDNYFDLVPGQEKTLIFISDDLLTDTQLKIMSMAEGCRLAPD